MVEEENWRRILFALTSVKVLFLAAGVELALLCVSDGSINDMTDMV